MEDLKKLMVGVVLIGSFLFSAPVFSSVTIIDGTGFDNVIKVQNKTLHLKGVALLRYLVFIEAYTGALYLPEASAGENALDDVMKHLVLDYRVAITAADFAKATRQKIKESVSDEVFVKLLPKIERLNGWYKDVKPGDRYTLDYIPGIGTTLSLNSKVLGTIEGESFARAMFGIWIGENPIDRGFRDRLIGKRE